MRFHSAVSEEPHCTAAAGQVAEEVRASPVGEPELLLVFASGYEVEDVERAVPVISRAFHGARILGCTAGGAIGDGRELQEGPALSLLAGRVPGGSLETFRLEPGAAAGPWPAALEEAAGGAAGLVCLGDPFSFPVQAFLERANERLEGLPVLGGMASAAASEGRNRLIMDGELHADGMVGLILGGDLRVDTVVSQGCRPIGHHFVITKGADNIVQEVGGRRALDVFRDIAGDLDDDELAMIQQGGLFLGRAINEYQSTFGRGDFLIQNVIGSDPSSGAIAVAGQVRVGTTAQFHVRDAQSADEDLRAMLRPHAVGAGAEPPAGALLVSCNGRGNRMWPESGHDAGVLRELCGTVPMAGFFAAGELGPVGGRNFVHGFTASIGLLRPA